MTTELQAVNQMLSVIAEAPVNSLVGALTTEVASAQRILAEVSQEVQGRAWYFNTNEDVTLTPDANDEINLSADIIRVDGLPHVEMVQVIQRGTRLYNRTDKNFVFSDPVRVNTTVLLPWDDVPIQAKTYIVTRASRIFTDRTIGASPQHNVALRDELKALASLKQWDAEHAGYNAIDLNVSVFSTLNRGIRGGRRWVR